MGDSFHSSWANTYLEECYSCLLLLSQSTTFIWVTVLQFMAYSAWRHSAQSNITGREQETIRIRTAFTKARNHQTAAKKAATSKREKNKIKKKSSTDPVFPFLPTSCPVAVWEFQRTVSRSFHQRRMWFPQGQAQKEPRSALSPSS